MFIIMKIRYFNTISVKNVGKLTLTRVKHWCRHLQCNVLSVIVNIAKISWARLHYDVIVTSYGDGRYFVLNINGKKRPVAIHW